MKKLLLGLFLVSLMTISVLALPLHISLRGSGGDATVNGIDLSNERVKFSAWVSDGYNSANSGQGYITMQGKSNGQRFRQSVKIVNSQIVQNTPSLLEVTSDGYYYVRNGWSIQKVQGKVDYTFDKNTGLTTITGSNGLNFQVTDIPTKQLRR